MTIIWVIIVIVLALYAVYAFNRLISLRNRTREAWSDIEVQLKRRYDLIPNLVNTVKGYASHEKEVFEKVTSARANALSAQGPKEVIQAENQLSQTLKSLFAVAEAYPNLRASENFQKLQDELTDAEDKIQASRRFYNGNVRDFNTIVEIFPSNVIANMFSFKSFELFELEEGEKVAANKAPEVKF
jgi:LemA protein